jgi:SNF2 family DNA or RNA helicase
LTATIAGAHIVVTSYALLRIDEEHLTDRSWGAVVLDEAQAVKNHKSRGYRVARSLRAPVKWCCSRVGCGTRSRRTAPRPSG